MKSELKSSKLVRNMLKVITIAEKTNEKCIKKQT